MIGWQRSSLLAFSFTSHLGLKDEREWDGELAKRTRGGGRAKPQTGEAVEQRMGPSPLRAGASTGDKGERGAGPRETSNQDAEGLATETGGEGRGEKETQGAERTRL